MPQTRFKIGALAIGLLLMVATACAQTTVYWDTNGNTTGSNNTGGTWSATGNTFWTTSATGTTGTSSWNGIATGSKIATFSAGTNATGTFTVSTSGTIANVGGLTFSEGTVTIGGTGTLSLTGAAALNVATTQANISATLGSTGSANKTGTGTLILSGANTFTGGMTVSAGTLGLGSNTAAGTGTLTLAGGTIYADGAARSLTNAVTVSGNFDVDGTNNLTLSGNMALGTTARTITVDNTGLTTFSGTISGTGGSINKAGTGTLVLSGNNTNTGGLTVSAGTLGFGSNTAAGTGTLTLAGGAIYADGAARTLTNAVNVTGNFDVDGTNNLTLSGNMGLGAATRTITVDNTGLTTFSGVISNTSGGLTKAGTGTLALSGANTFTGNINVNAGTLRVASDGNLGNSANDLALNSGTLETTNTFTLNAGRVVTVGSSGGTLDVNSGTTLTLGTAGQLTGSGNLTKANSGTLAISAGNTGYTGNTNLNGGVIQLSTYDGLGTGTANTLTINNGAELAANFASNTNFQSNILINDGTIRRTNNTDLKAGFQNNVGTVTSLTVAGSAQIIDQGGDGANGFLTLDGIVNVNSGGSLAVTASTANDEIRLGGAQNINLAAGSTLTTSGSGLVAFGSGAARTIVGQGTSTQESKLVLGATTNSANAGTSFQVNGSGTGGLRIEGTKAKVDQLVTDSRLANTTGTGGTLTIAYTDAGNRTLGSTANLLAASSVVLGLESNGGTFTLGTAGGGTGDLGNWGGLTVGANTAATFADSNVFGSTDSLTLLGGTLNLNNTIQNFGTLSVTANSIIDFSGSASMLNLTNFVISAGVTLTIQNWQNAVNFFSSDNWTGATYNTMGSSPMNQVVFAGFNGNQTIWDSMDNQIRPNVPEPSTYGALLLAALLGIFGWRRIRQQRPVAIPIRIRADVTRSAGR